MQTACRVYSYQGFLLFVQLSITFTVSVFDTILIQSLVLFIE